MARYSNESDLSELEQEFELEMDNLEFEGERNMDEELGDEEFEGTGDYEEDLQREFEGGDEENTDYAERFYELSQMEHESESDLDREVHQLLNEMEQEYFSFGGLGKLAKKGWSYAKKKGIEYAKKRFPALQAITQLTRGNLKGLLASLAKTALAASPAGAVALPALSALGFESGEDSGANREAWDNYVGVCKEAFENLAENLNERADEPLEASRLATKAFQTALTRPRGRFQPGGRLRGPIAGPYGRGRRRVIYVNPNKYKVALIRRR
jgi:hypothetical protein